MTPARTLDDYINLIGRFVAGHLSAPEFATEYFALMGTESTFWPTATYDILNDLFADVDAYCADPTIRSANDLDEAQLGSAAAEALRKLNELSTHGGPE